MLNDGYTVLEGSVRVDVIADGYDPSIGIMHVRMESEGTNKDSRGLRVPDLNLRHREFTHVNSGDST